MSNFYNSFMGQVAEDTAGMKITNLLQFATQVPQ
jgi:hypothetical protein